MIRAYVVTEGRTDLEILRRILPQSLTDETELIAGSGSYSALSLAVSLLATRKRPVALVVDADTENLRLVREREEFLRDLLRQAGSDERFGIFTAVPVLEAVFFQQKALLEQITDRTLTDADWEANRHDPKGFLSRTLNGSTPAIQTVLSRLNDEQVRVLQEHSLVRQLSDFLKGSTNGRAATLDGEESP